MGEICCALTGHRNLNGELDCELLERALINLIESRGVTTFYNGMAKGFDLESAKIIIKLKKRYEIKLIACVPCRGQERAFTERQKLDYYNVLSACDDEVVLSENYYVGCMQARDRYMVDNSSIVLAFLRELKGGTYYTVSYAERMGKELYII
ncbi:MAG: SLOG family protein [Candidatus Coproplasma sp.]